jgi:DegV family protein with EDD domain
MGIKIVTDTSCDLPARLERELRELGVDFVPFLFHFGLDALKDKTISMREFIARADRIWPTTAVPSIDTLLQIFRERVEAGHQVLCITVTGKHSAMFSAATMASRQFPEGQVHVMDSQSLSLGQGLQVLAAARAVQAGESIERIKQSVCELRERLQLFITLDTVKYLVRGGRASRLAGGLAEILKIRPILTVRDGELMMVDKSRGRKAAKRRLLELARQYLPAEALGVAHILAEEEAKELATEIARDAGISEESILMTETGMVLATHGGPGTLAIVLTTM